MKRCPIDSFERAPAEKIKNKNKNKNQRRAPEARD
jgi:hypothetical protein